VASHTKRTFYYDGAGESGILKATLKHSAQLIRCAIVVSFYFIYRVVFGRYSNRNVFIDSSTDLWDDDGTVMEGEEAVANLRIMHERLTPFMAEMEAQMAAKK
jgi:hypothetical protein